MTPTIPRSTAPSEQDEQDLIDQVAEAIYNSSFKNIRPPWNIMKQGNPEVFEAYRDNAREDAHAALDIILPHLESQAAAALAQRDAEIVELTASRDRLARSVEFWVENTRQMHQTYLRSHGMDEPDPWTSTYAEPTQEEAGR